MPCNSMQSHLNLNILSVYFSLSPTAFQHQRSKFLRRPNHRLSKLRVFPGIFVSTPLQTNKHPRTRSTTNQVNGPCYGGGKKATYRTSYFLPESMYPGPACGPFLGMTGGQSEAPLIYNKAPPPPVQINEQPLPSYF